jgi:hypothetical protein
MLLGGIMGIIKVLIPNMSWFSFRHILGFDGTFDGFIPAYTVIYGICMAVLEIISSVLMLAKHRIGIVFSIITLLINALGCTVSIILGDLVAIGSLLLRFAGIYILYINKEPAARVTQR